MTVHHTITVNATPDAAFNLFVNHLADWWPPDYTWSRDVLATIAIEPRTSGRCYEVGPHGFALDWGRVLVYDPPQRISFTWQISPQRVPEPNPAKCSRVEVRFVAGDNPITTRVELEHSDFERHGEGAADYEAAMGSPQGWPFMLTRYAALAEG